MKMYETKSNELDETNNKVCILRDKLTLKSNQIKSLKKTPVNRASEREK